MRTTDQFDPLAYIEKAFLDSNPQGVEAPKATDSVGNIALETHPSNSTDPAPLGIDSPKSRKRFRRTEMSAPRPRRAAEATSVTIEAGIQEIWEDLPRNIEFLMSYYDDSVTANYYRGEFKESRNELIRRLLDPQLSLEETSRLLGVCPATVRRYTNRGWLKHHRTQGGQRRFRLSDICRFVAEHGRFPED